MNRTVIIIRGGCIVGVYSGTKQDVQVIDASDLVDANFSEKDIRETINKAREGLEEIY